MPEFVEIEGLRIQKPEGRDFNQEEIDAIFQEVSRRSGTPPVPSQAAQDPRTVVTKESLRPGALVAGGLGGAALGAPAGPLGAAAGGVLGTTLASLGTDFAGELAREAGVREGLLGPPVTAAESTTRALKEGAIDAAFLGAGPLARSLGGRAKQVLGGVSGARAVRLATDARDLGIPLGVVDVTENEAIKASQRIIGVFPFIGAPFRGAFRAKSAAIEAAKDRLLWKVGPSVSAAEAGIDLNKAAVGRIKFLRTRINEAYDLAFRLADDSLTTVPTDRLKGEAAAMVSEAAQRRPPVTKLVKGVPKKGFLKGSKARRKTADAFIKELSNLDDSITPRQFRGLMDDLDDFMGDRTLPDTSLRRLIRIKKASEIDFANLRGTPEVVEAFANAKKTFGETMRLFESPGVQAFAQVDRKVFSAGAPQFGSNTADELLTLAIKNQKAPEKILEVRKLLGTSKAGEGRQAFNEASRRLLDDIFETSVQTKNGFHQINVDALKKSLGLGSPKSLKRAITEELLADTKVSVRDLEKFMDVVEVAQGEGFPAFSQFMSRRVTLGGPRALVSGLLPASATLGSTAAGAGLLGGPVAASAALGISFAARGYGNIVTDPIRLKLATRMLDPKVSNELRRQATVRFLRLSAGITASGPRQDTGFAHPKSKKGAQGELSSLEGFLRGTELQPSGFTQKISPQGRQP